MNLKQKIEEWEIKESRNKLLSWEGGQHPYFIHENFLIDSSKNYNEIMQALKEAAKIIKVQSDFTGKDEYNPNGDWLKKWGLE